MSTAVENAERIARIAHKGQLRKDGSAYIRHPEAVARAAQATDLSEPAVAAAWLHDVLEDTAMTPESLIAEGVPLRVVGMVRRLTSPLTKLTACTRFRRKWAQFEQLRYAGYSVKAVKLLDREHNLSEVSALPIGFQCLYAMESVWLLDVLQARADAIGERVLAQAQTILGAIGE